MTKKKKEQETYGNRKNHLNCYPFIFYIEGKIRHFSNPIVLSHPFFPLHKQL